MSTTRPQRQRSLSSKQGGSNNPFGAALPREEILQQRGLDVAKIDDFFEKKAAVRSYTAAQEAELETVRAQLGAITAELRHANEHELPEETFRLAEQAKRQELNDLVEKFGQLNTTATVAEDEQQQQAVRHKAYVPRGAVRNSKDHHHHDEQQHRSYGSHNRSGNGKYNDKKHVEFGRNEEKREDSDAYASFFSNRRRQSHEEQHA